MANLHILVIRFSSLGDIVLNSSLPHAIKQRWGERVKISWVTSGEFAPLLEGHSSIDNVISFDRKSGLKNLYKIIDDLHQSNKIDLMLDLHGTLRSLALRMKFRSIPRLYVDKRSLERWLLTGLKIDLLTKFGFSRKGGSFGELLLERNPRDFSGLFDLSFSVDTHAKSLNSDVHQLSSLGPYFSDDTFDLSPYGDLERKKYIVICPSASFPEKRWSIENFVTLTKKLLNEPLFKERKFIVLAGPADTFCNDFNSLVEQSSGRLINLQGKTNLIETTHLVKDAEFCIGNDTGVPHIAESMGTPSLFILGPTGEQGGFYPHLDTSRTIFKTLWCRPCTTNGKGSCIRSERYCLTKISTDEVLDMACDLSRGIS